MKPRTSRASCIPALPSLRRSSSTPVVVTGDSYAADEVSPGCRFIVKDLEEDEEEEYHFVGSQEADPMDGKISDESPFGKAMLGKKVGDVVEVEAPIGIVKYEILKIEK